GGLAEIRLTGRRVDVPVEDREVVRVELARRGTARGVADRARAPVRLLTRVPGQVLLRERRRRHVDDGDPLLEADLVALAQVLGELRPEVVPVVAHGLRRGDELGERVGGVKRLPEALEARLRRRLLDELL